MSRRLVALLALSVLVTLGVSLAVLLGWSPGVAGQWQWLSQPLRLGRVWIPIAWLLCAVVGGLLLWRLHIAGRLRPWLVASALWLAAWSWSLALMATQPHWWVKAAGIVTSPVATTYFNEATRASDLHAYLSDYPRLMPTLTQHASTHPPGPIAIFWLLDRVVQGSPFLQSLLGRMLQVSQQAEVRDLTEVLNRSFARFPGFYTLAPADALAALLAVLLLPACGALAAPCLWAAGRRLGGVRMGLTAGVLAVLVPSWALFAPGMDQVLTALAAGFAMALAAAAAGSLAGGLCAGLLLAAAMWISPGAAALGAWGLVWLVLARRGKGVPRAAGAAAVAFALGMLGAGLAAGINYLQILQAGLQAHHTITTQTARSYLPWLLWNPLDFTLFCGPVVVILALGRLFRPAARPAWLWAWLAVMAALVLSGVVRGEVGRIWGFLMVPAVLAAASLVGTLSPRAGRITVLVTAGLLALQGLAFRLGMVLISPW